MFLHTNTVRFPLARDLDLLKLSEVEDQFRQLTNKFEEINFKLDKLSNRLSKIQADNQIRFQDLETAMS